MITIDRAIQRLTEGPKVLPGHDPEYKEAVQLGRAALARIRYQRQKPTVPHKTLLPGETKGEI